MPTERRRHERAATRPIAWRIADARRPARAEPRGPVPAEFPQAVGRADGELRRRARRRSAQLKFRPPYCRTGRATRSSIRGLPSPPTAGSRPTPASASSARASTRRRCSWSPRSSACRWIASRSIQCDTGVTPDQGTTSGAQSHPANFNHANLALAAATAREALVRLASARLGGADRPVSRRRTASSRRQSRSDRRPSSYGELIGGRTFDLPLDSNAARRHPRDWTVLGTADAARRPSRHGDRRVRVRAQRARAGHAARRGREAADGGRHARQRRRTLGAATCPASCASSSKNNFVGVVAEKPWQAMQAAEKLRVEWIEGHEPAGRSASCTTTFGAGRRAATRCSSIQATSTNG